MRLRRSDGTMGEPDRSTGLGAQGEQGFAALAEADGQQGHPGPGSTWRGDGTRMEGLRMYARFKVLGAAMVVVGLVFIGVGGYTFTRTEEGNKSLQSFSTAQDVKLSYNDQGQLTDRGDPAQAEKILSLLTDDWGYTVVAADLNPNDPLVNTATEYMYQMAAIASHTLNSTQTVAVADHTDYNDQHFMPGEYEFKVDGRYWSQFDRQNPIEGKAREQAWTGTAHALIAELGVGSVTASVVQMGFGIAALAAALGATLVLLGAGLVWAGRRAP